MQQSHVASDHQCKSHHQGDDGEHQFYRHRPRLPPPCARPPPDAQSLPSSSARCTLGPALRASAPSLGDVVGPPSRAHPACPPRSRRSTWRSQRERGRGPRRARVRVPCTPGYYREQGVRGGTAGTVFFVRGAERGQTLLLHSQDFPAHQIY